MGVINGWIVRTTGALLAYQVAAVAAGGVAQAGHGPVCSSSGDGRALAPDTQFYVYPPADAAVQQIKALKQAHDRDGARRLSAMESIPQAVWFTTGSPSDVEQAVRQTMRAAAQQGGVPVLVAYNLPFRDCAQYSAGGAIDTAAYDDWIDGFARGIGKDKAVVILEPDGLGLIPFNTTISGDVEWCQPTVTDAAGNATPAPGASPTERYAQLNHAVDSIEGQAPRAAVYLDGSHSDWLAVGDAAYRLVSAGVQRAQGFFLNVSNYQPTDQNMQFGTWVSDCIAAATAGDAAGHFDWCPSQYDPATGYTTVNYTPDFEATITAGLVSLMGSAAATTHFVVDTGRNGHGPWIPTVTYPDAQDWCNAPGRGVGPRPTAATGVPLADAELWIKTPGHSDGSCNRGVAGSTTDPEWRGIVDPVAGDWFPQEALQLATLANPPLL